MNKQLGIKAVFTQLLKILDTVCMVSFVFIVFILIGVLFSYLRPVNVEFSGTVVDGYTGLPIDGAEVVTSESATLYTDSRGNFAYQNRVVHGHSNRLEVLVSKEGYQPTYFLLNQQRANNLKLEIYQGESTLESRYSPHLLTASNYAGFIVFIFSLFTGAFLFLKGVRYRILWLVVIFLTAITLSIDYITGYVYWSFSNLGDSVKWPGFAPFHIRILFPLGAILFWILYFTKREFVMNKKDN